MKIAIGMITRDFLECEPLLSFINNAHIYGYTISAVIVCASGTVDQGALIDIVRITRLEVISDIGLIAYGNKRNAVMMKAMELDCDFLFFIDTDVYPVLMIDHKNETFTKDINFFGEHLKYMEDPDVIVTTSDYSGYNIIPPMNFEHIEEFFTGIQKEAIVAHVKSEDYKSKCLVFDAYPNNHPFETNKILGGNLALKLSAFKKILPFFSTTYEFKGATYLTRGEDTLLGTQIAQSNKYKCIDIDHRIFHNTFGDFPNFPDVRQDERIKDRFFYACMGWIGRNPFLNWLCDEDLDLIKVRQYEAMKIGAPYASEYFSDERFLWLPEAVLTSYDNIDATIRTYKIMAKEWKAFINHLSLRRAT